MPCVSQRYGSHSIDLSPATKQAFVPHVGRNSIYIYDINDDGTLAFAAEAPSFGHHDGPRHVVPSRDGKKLYVVTEHTSWVDVYAIHKDSLEHLQRLSVIPTGQSPLPNFPFSWFLFCVGG